MHESYAIPIQPIKVAEDSWLPQKRDNKSTSDEVDYGCRNAEKGTLQYKSDIMWKHFHTCILLGNQKCLSCLSLWAMHEHMYIWTWHMRSLLLLFKLNTILKACPSFISHQHSKPKCQHYRAFKWLKSGIKANWTHKDGFPKSPGKVELNLHNLHMTKLVDERYIAKQRYGSFTWALNTMHTAV